MKLKHLVIALLLVVLCVFTVTNAPKADAAVATYATISHNLGSSNQTTVGGAVTFTMASDGNSHTLWIYDITRGTSTYYQNAGTSYTLTFPNAGKYQALVQSWGDNGSAPMSSRITFYVGLPTYATLTLNRDAILTGNSITFNMASDGASNTLWVYNPDGSTYGTYQNAGASKTITFSTAGKYTALLETWNGQGSKKSSTASFTVVNVGGMSMALSGNVTSGSTVHGNVVYTVALKNNSNLPVNNIAFKVTATNGSETHTLYTASGNSGTAGTGTTASKTGAFGNLAAGSTLTITLTVNSDNSAFDDNSTYTVQVQAGTCSLVGLDAGSSALSFAASGTQKFKPTSGSVAMSWTPSIDSGKIVEGTYTYTITFTNNTNHSITGIDYTLKYGDTTVVTVSNGAVTTSGCATADKTTLGDVAAGKNVVLVVTIDTTKLTDKTGYTFTVAGGTCNATGIAGSNASYGLNANFSKTHAITVRGGGVTMTWTTVTDKAVVEGKITYTITFTNNTNHTITGIDFTLKEGSTALVTVSNGTVTVNATDYITASKETLGNLDAGKNVQLVITVDTTKLNDKSSHTYTLAGGSSNATGIVGSNSGIELKPSTNSYTHTFTVAGGSVSLTWSTVTNNAIVEGNITYTITFTNNTNHTITGIDFTLKEGDTALVTVTNGTVTVNATTYVTASKETLGNVAAGKTVQLVVTVDTTKLNDNTKHTYTMAGGTCNATGLAGDNSGYGLNASASASHTFTVRSGGVTMTWTPSISSGKVVEGTYTYIIRFTNNTNHAINGIDFKLKVGNTDIVTVSNMAVSKSGDYVSINKTSLGETLAKGAYVELEVTIDTTKLTDKQDYTFTLYGGSSNATGIAGSNSTIELVPGTNSYTHAITVRGGGITVTITGDRVVNGGVGVGTENFTITITNGTNHAIKDVAITLKDSAGNTLLTISKDGTLSVVDGTLVKNSTVSITGSQTILAANGKITITGIQIDAEATKLDAAGRLILVASGTSTATDIVGSNSGIALNDSSDNYAMMVRHDVDLIVQAGVSTTIDASKILAAMQKSGATAYNGISAISAVTVTDANGNTVTKTGFGSNGSSLIVNLENAYSEYIIKVSYSGGTILVPIQVTTAESGDDKTFVLDYGLPVSIDEATMLDDAALTRGSYSTVANAVIGFANALGGESGESYTGTFGSFTFANSVFGYTTSKFMDDEDAAYIVILVGNEAGTENVDFVKVYKRLSFIPSNVIYYEDTLGSIKYPGSYNLTELGNLSSIGVSGEQDLPQTGNMGFDDGSYANAEDVMISGESVQKVTVEGEQVTVTFSFTGTGFELISRVNAYDAATILVKVSPTGKNQWTWYPVVTRFNPTNDPNAATEVYQVPVFKLNEVAYGTYDVEVVGLPMQDYDENGNGLGWTTSYIYIDGIRVYNPLGTSDLTSHYGVEQNAQFINLRDMIMNGSATMASYTTDGGNQITGFTAAGSYYLNSDSNRFTAAVGSLDALGAIGANNEVLIRQSQSTNQVVILRVTDNGDGFLQVGIHDIHDGKFDGSSDTNLSSTVKYNTTSGWVVLKENFYSGTEQYYNIDLSLCPVVDGYKIVALQVSSGFVSFTNLKYKNITFASIDPAAAAASVSFNDDGTMLMIDAEGNETTGNAGDLFNLNEVNYMLSQGDAGQENE